jgi:hypothetical protein
LTTGYHALNLLECSSRIYSQTEESIHPATHSMVDLAEVSSESRNGQLTWMHAVEEGEVPFLVKWLIGGRIHNRELRMSLRESVVVFEVEGMEFGEKFVDLDCYCSVSLRTESLRVCDPSPRSENLQHWGSQAMEAAQECYNVMSMRYGHSASSCTLSHGADWSETDALVEKACALVDWPLNSLETYCIPMRQLVAYPAQRKQRDCTAEELPAHLVDDQVKVNPRRKNWQAKLDMHSFEDCRRIETRYKIRGH